VRLFLSGVVEIFHTHRGFTDRVFSDHLPEMFKRQPKVSVDGQACCMWMSA